MMEICVNNVTKNFGFKNVLDKLNFEVKTQEKIALVGEYFSRNLGDPIIVDSVASIIKEINNDISTHTNIYSSVAKINGRLTYIDSIKMQYIDSFGTDNQTSSGQFTNDYMFIASRNGTESFLNGTIMSVRVYNRALTEEEIISNYNADLFMN